MKKVLTLLLLVIGSVLLVGFIEKVLNISVEPYYMIMILVLVLASLGYYNKK